MRFLVGLGIALLFALAASPAPAQQQPADLELVLAVDTSSSVNRGEFDLQMSGLANAFRDPRVQKAIAAAGAFGIAVALVQWADSRHQTLSIDWFLVRTPEDAEALADLIDGTPRFVVGGGTAIGSAVMFALDLLATNPYAGLRAVIDVSGDGRANQGELPTNARARALAEGVTVNGLAILNEDPALNVYYLQYVIAGPGAFVLTAQDYEAFSDAIVEKLVREITGAPVADLGHPGPPPVGRMPVDRIPVDRIPVDRMPAGRIPAGGLPATRH